MPRTHRKEREPQRRISRAIGKSFDLKNQRMTQKLGKTFGLFKGYFIYCHHIEPRVKLYSLREESFTIPIKYIDVSRTTHTNLDVMQESRIDDHWNIDGSRDSSDSWTGFTQFTLSDEKPPDGYMWSG